MNADLIRVFQVSTRGRPKPFGPGRALRLVVAAVVLFFTAPPL